MPVKTLDEYLKQATVITATKLLTTKPKYRILGFYKETEFQDTPIGKIPKDWKVAKLGDICRFKRGFSYRSNQITKNPTKIRFITINDVEKEGGLKRNAEKIYIKENINIDRGFFLNDGDILIANTDMSKGFIIGAPILIEGISGRIAYSMDLTKLILNRSIINSKFLFYYLTFEPVRQKMKSFAQGTNVLHLNHNLVKNIKIPLPPLEEQRGIAEILSTLDNAIEVSVEYIEKLERLKRDLMQELLTKGIGHREFKETPIGKIPKEWRLVKIKDITIFLRRGKNPKYGTSNVVVIKTAYNYPDKIRFEDAPRADPTFIRKLPKDYFLKPGDILVNSTGTGSVGRVGFFEGYELPCTVDGHITILRVKQDIVLPKYVFYYLSSSYGFKALESRAVGSTNQIELYVDAIGSIHIPLPPLEEQKRIATILSTIDKWIELEKKRKEKLECLKRGLMELLLTGRVRVRVEAVGSSSGG